MSILLIGIAVVLSFGVSSVAAANNNSAIYVNTTGSDNNNGTSWQLAKATITNATGTVADNGTIYIADGTYNESNMTINTNMTIIGESQTGTIINAQTNGYIFNIASGVTLNLINLTLENGSSGNGGAIYNYGTLTSTNSTFTNNTATGSGGSIYNDGNLTVTNGTFNYNNGIGGAIYNSYSSSMALTGTIFNQDSNTADYDGIICNDGYSTVLNSTFTGTYYGGTIWNNLGTMIVTDTNFNNITTYWGVFWNDGNLTLTNSTFNNYFGTDSYGVINNYGTLNVTGSTFKNNTGTGVNGGAIYNDGTLTITNSILTGNTATDGGAIYNDGPLTITNSILTGNTASDGGAIYNYGPLTITNSTLTDNNATEYDGGAIYNDGTLTITNSTLAGNTAPTSDGGAIFNMLTSEDASSTITDSILINNTAKEGGAIWSGADGYAANFTLNFNRIVNNTATNYGGAIYNNDGNSLNATDNWWGSNNPNFSNLIEGNVNCTQWLYMTLTANPTTINNRETSLITTSFNNLYNGTTITTLDPTSGHIPDGTPVNFQTDRGTIDCNSTDKNTNDGIAIATLNANELAGIANLNATTDTQTLFANVTINPKSSIYLTVTPGKINPVAGDTVIYTLKVGNNGPDSATDVMMTYTIPEGLEYAGTIVDTGKYTYNTTTRTITWIIGNVPVGDPYMWLTLHIARPGQYLINPVLNTSTYDPTINNNTQSIIVNAKAQTNTNGNTTANSTTKTIGMKNTGLPIAGFAFAVLSIFGGLVSQRRK